MLRTLVLGKLGVSGHEITVKEALSRFDKHVSGETALDADLRSPVYSTAVKHGSQQYFDKVMKVCTSYQLLLETCELDYMYPAVSHRQCDNFLLSPVLFIKA